MNNSRFGQFSLVYGLIISLFLIASNSHAAFGVDPNEFPPYSVAIKAQIEASRPTPETEKDLQIKKANCSVDKNECFKVSELIQTIEQQGRKCADAGKQVSSDLDVAIRTAIGIQAQSISNTQAVANTVEDTQNSTVKTAGDTASTGAEGSKLKAQACGNVSKGAKSVAGEVAGLDKITCQNAARPAIQLASKAQACAASSSMSATEMMQMGQTAMGIAQGLKSLLGDGEGGAKAGGISGPSSKPGTFARGTASNGGGLSMTSGAAKPGDVAGAGAVAQFGNSGSKDFSAKDALDAMAFDYKADPAAAGLSDKSSSLSGGGGGGIGGMSGASVGKIVEAKVLENTKGTNDIAAVDFDSGGGGGRSSFLGLKSGKTELDDLVKEEPSFSPITGTSEEARELASASEEMTDVNANPEVSIFLVVSSKLKDMKKRGYL